MLKCADIMIRCTREVLSRHPEWVIKVWSLPNCGLVPLANIFIFITLVSLLSMERNIVKYSREMNRREIKQ